jgi:hypothetical protein
MPEYSVNCSMVGDTRSTGRQLFVRPLSLTSVSENDHLMPEDVQACLAYASEVLKSERVYLLPGA